jgi:hypothetical protein
VSFIKPRSYVLISSSILLSRLLLTVIRDTDFIGNNGAVRIPDSDILSDKGLYLKDIHRLVAVGNTRKNKHEYEDTVLDTDSMRTGDTSGTTH